MTVETIEPEPCPCGLGVSGHDPGHPRVPRPGYTFRQASRCRGCGARMYWWETVAGKLSPHDLDGTTHFATCPVRERFRK